MDIKNPSSVSSLQSNKQTGSLSAEMISLESPKPDYISCGQVDISSHWK